MSFTRPQLRAKAYNLGWKLGFARTATSIAADGPVDAVAFQDSSSATGNYEGMIIYLPSEVAANQIRLAGPVNSTKLTHAGLAYTGLSTLNYEIVGRLHPDEFNDAIRLALRRVYFETWAPLTPWLPDGDFASSQVDGTSGSYNWTGAASGTTPSKVSSGDPSGLLGYNSLRLTNAGSVTTPSFYVAPGDELVHGASSRVTTTAAAAKYSLLDVTHSNAVIGTPVSHSYLNQQHFILKDTIPAGCYEVKAKLEVTGAGGIADWDYTFGHLSGRESGQVVGPSWGTEKWRLWGFGPAEYGRSTATQVGGVQYNARSRRFNEWREGGDNDYVLYPLTEEANPYFLQVNREQGLGFEDYWFHGLRPHSDINELTDETSTTKGPEDLLMAAIRAELALKLLVSTRDAMWDTELKRAEADLAVQRSARRPSSPRRERSVYIVGGRNQRHG